MERNLFKSVEYEITDTPEGFDLWLFSDTHADTRNFDGDRFAKFIKSANKPNSYVIGLGDYHDFPSMKELQKLRNAELHETTEDTLDQMVEEKNRKFAKMMSPLRGKIICLLGGNHQYANVKGYNADEDLCTRLGTTYAGNIAIIRIKVKFPTKKQAYAYLTLFCAHGRGGGRLLGTSINQVADMFTIFPGMDIYAMGHDHKRSATPQPYLTLSPYGTIKEKRCYFVRSGSFMKSYEFNTSGYAQGKMMRPVDLGPVCIHCKLERDYKNGNDELKIAMEARI